MPAQNPSARGGPAIEIRALRQTIEETQRQLSQLITTVSELTTALKVEDTKRADLERRVSNLERDEDDSRKRSSDNGDQRAISLQIIAISGTISFISSIILFALSHISWK